MRVSSRSVAGKLGTLDAEAVRKAVEQMAATGLRVPAFAVSMQCENAIEIRRKATDEVSLAARRTQANS